MAEYKNVKYIVEFKIRLSPTIVPNHVRIENFNSNKLLD